jgi:hypothetical protein
MAGCECYHCKRWIEEGQEHDCWTTTESALTRNLPEDLRDAWERVRETAVTFGAQRIYASHKSIMFSRQSCYFFVRPKSKFLELWFFLGREVKASQVRRVDRTSKTKLAHMLRITHRDEVEAPITDWLREAYAFCEAPPAMAAKQSTSSTRPKAKPKAKAKSKPARRASHRSVGDPETPARNSQSPGHACRTEFGEVNRIDCNR